MKILTLRGVKTLMRKRLQVKEKRKTPANGKMINFILCLKMFKMPSTMPNWRKSILISITDWDSSMTRSIFSPLFSTTECLCIKRSGMKKRKLFLNQNCNGKKKNLRRKWNNLKKRFKKEIKAPTMFFQPYNLVKSNPQMPLQAEYLRRKTETLVFECQKKISYKLEEKPWKEDRQALIKSCIYRQDVLGVSKSRRIARAITQNQAIRYLQVLPK